MAVTGFGTESDGAAIGCATGFRWVSPLGAPVLVPVLGPGIVDHSREEIVAIVHLFRKALYLNFRRSLPSLLAIDRKILFANQLNDAMRAHERRLKFALRSVFARLFQRVLFRTELICTRKKAKVKQAGHFRSNWMETLQ
ncbi:hypothetical protein HED54_15760 [Ochrobactrum anthropi ATCC 49188]|nr:hypothetical protein [Brucella anthropi ATCC 49188]